MARILIVDDEPLNLKLLRAQLTMFGHEVAEADCGERALQLARDTAPDLVLLDVMMPGLSGIETAKRLKAQASPQFLPVVLVTALTDVPTRLQGLEAGVDDFLTKPVDAVFLKLRVANLLALREDRSALEERNKKLAEVQRLRSEMTALLVHDMKNPASVIMTNIDFARSGLGAGADRSLFEALDDALEGCRRLIRLLGNVLDVGRAEDGQLELRRVAVDVADVIAPLVQVRLLTARNRGIALDVCFKAGSHACVDPDVIGRVFENLLDNAFHNTRTGGSIQVTGGVTGGQLKVTVANTGSAVAPESRRAIFDKYGGREAKGSNHVRTGLGLYFCRLAVEAHGGTISVEEGAELPVSIVVSLPSGVEERR